MLSGSDINRNFRGFLIQGRIAADSSTTAGMFIDNGSNQQVTCDVSTSIYGPIAIYSQLYLYITDTV